MCYSERIMGFTNFCFAQGYVLALIKMPEVQLTDVCSNPHCGRISGPRLFEFRAFRLH